MDNKLKRNQNKIFLYIKKYLNSYPYFCVIILHEYSRNLCPHDPHIKFKINNPKKRIHNLQIKLISILKNLDIFGFYKIKLTGINDNEELKKRLAKYIVNFGKHFHKKKIITLKHLS